MLSVIPHLHHQCLRPVYNILLFVTLTIVLNKVCVLGLHLFAAIIFVYDYHPGSETLLMKHFSPSEQLNGYADPFSADPSAPRPYSHQKNALLRQQHGGGSGMLPEGVIWNYIIQLTSALRVIHAAGLACRTLDPTKILLTGRSRLRLSSLAIADVLTFDSTSPNPLQLIPHFQVRNHSGK